MINKDEALKMAVEVLYLVEEYDDNGVNVAKKAIQACKEALEPEIELADTISVEDYQKLREQPAQEPVAWLSTNSKANEVIKTHQWHGLSDDEIWDIANFLGKNKEWDYPVMFAKTIEKVLREKNT